LVGAFDSAGGSEQATGVVCGRDWEMGTVTTRTAALDSAREETKPIQGGSGIRSGGEGFSSGWFGFRFGLGAYRFGDGEFLRQFLERLRIGAPGDSDEPVHARQRNAFESCIGIGVGSPEARFRFARAAKAPIVLDERIDQKLLDLGDRPELSLVVGGQGFEFGEGFTGEDGFFGVDARFDRV
jgi:hypothetical protein